MQVGDRGGGTVGTGGVGGGAVHVLFFLPVYLPYSLLHCDLCTYIFIRIDWGIERYEFEFGQQHTIETRCARVFGTYLVGSDESGYLSSTQLSHSVQETLAHTSCD